LNRQQKHFEIVQSQRVSAQREYGRARFCNSGPSASRRWRFNENKIEARVSMSTMNKVAKVNIFFWVMKISATTLGETGGDLLSMTMNVGYAISSLILLSFFFVTLVVQLSTRKYHPTIYWLVIVSTSTAGTTMSDYMDRTLGLGYFKGSLILVSCLIAILAVWRYSEGRLSVNYIQTKKAEIFYWTAILFSNTLGTALLSAEC
jgi:uncharacterized membrane-anchored protein